MMNRQLDVWETQVVRVFLFFILKVSYALRMLVNIIMTKSSSHRCFQEVQLKLSKFLQNCFFINGCKSLSTAIISQELMKSMGSE